MAYVDLETEFLDQVTFFVNLFPVFHYINVDLDLVWFTQTGLLEIPHVAFIGFPLIQQLPFPAKVTQGDKL